MVVSAAVHVVVVWLVVRGESREAHVAGTSRVHVETPLPPQTQPQPEPMLVEMIDSGGGNAGSRTSGSPRRAAHVASTRARSADAWSGVSIRTERPGEGHGGTGTGTGFGSGIGFGDGAQVQVARDVPAPPVPRVSKARPAKLIWPTRDEDVVDDEALFVAKVTVDTDGAVVGARMVTNRPGSRGEHAANAIWTFRYAPALDDDGMPVRSTFEQPFQVR